MGLASGSVLGTGNLHWFPVGATLKLIMLNPYWGVGFRGLILIGFYSNKHLKL